MGKGWYTQAKQSGQFWYIMKATTIGLPAAYLSAPLFDGDGTFRGVLIHQFGIGATETFTSPFSDSIKTFIGSRTDLQVYVVRQSDGALLATGGNDVNYYDMDNKEVIKAKDFTANEAISATAKARDGRLGVAGSFTTEKFMYEVVPLDDGATAKTGWSVVAVKSIPEKPSKTNSDAPSTSKKPEEGPAGGWIAFIVLLVFVILYAGYVLYSRNRLSDALPTKSFQNPVSRGKKHIELA